MLVIVYRFVKEPLEDKSEPVDAKIVVSDEGRITEAGVLNFPNKMTWQKFYGSLQKGALSIRDLDVRLENASEGFDKKEKGKEKPNA